MYSPYSKYEELAKKRWSTINDAAISFQQKYSNEVLNFNIMIPQRRFFYRIEPNINNNNKSKFTNNLFKQVQCSSY